MRVGTTICLVLWIAQFLVTVTKAAEPELLALNGVRFQIPSELIHDRAIDSAGQIEIIALEMFWPDFTPKTHANRKEWRLRNPQRDLRILLLRRGLEGQLRLENALKLHMRDPDVEPGPAGLTKYSKGIWRRFAFEDARYRTPKGYPVVLNCRDGTPRTKQLFEFEALCSVEYEIFEQVWLHYSFFMVNLENWEQIDRSVRRYVEALRVPGD